MTTPSCTAARAWRPRSTGSPSTRTISAGPSASSWRRAARRRRPRASASETPTAACGRCWSPAPCLLALAVVAGVVALSQRGEARDAALIADAQRLGADALNRDRLDDAALLARGGIDLDESVATRSSLGSVLLPHPAALGELPDRRLAVVHASR